MICGILTGWKICRLNLPPLELKFDLPPVKFGEVRSEKGVPLKNGSRLAELFAQSRPSDRSLKDVNQRLRGKVTHFNDAVVSDTLICPTIVSSGTLLRQCDGQKFSDADIITCQTFPQDFDFCGRSVQYICGMSVPPNMMAHIAAEIWRQWLQNIKKCDNI